MAVPAGKMLMGDKMGYPPSESNPGRGHDMAGAASGRSGQRVPISSPGDRRPGLDHATFRTWRFDFCALGTTISRTPSLSCAFALSISTAIGNITVRSNAPWAISQR